MNKIVSVELLKDGDRFEFITSRSEWADNCFLPHPKGVIVVAKSSFTDPFNQCRFCWRLEKFPNGKPQDWWGGRHTEVRLLGRQGATPQEPAKKPAKGKQSGQK